MDSKKLDPHTLEVTRAVSQTATYELGALKAQRAQIQASRDAELAEVDALIAEAEKLGIVARADDAVPVALPVALDR